MSPRGNLASGSNRTDNAAQKENFEIADSKSETSRKFKTEKQRRKIGSGSFGMFGVCRFEFVSDFVLRISDFLNPERSLRHESSRMS